MLMNSSTAAERTGLRDLRVSPRAWVGSAVGVMRGGRYMPSGLEGSAFGNLAVGFAGRAKAAGLGR